MKKIFKLREYYIRKIRADIMNSPAGLKDNPFIDYDILRNPDDEREYAMILRVQAHSEIEEGKPHLDIDAEIVGVFAFDEGATTDEMEIVARINGGTVLYGLLRGYLVSVTGGFPCRKFDLPSLYMQDIIPSVEERKKALNQEKLTGRD